MEPYTAFPDKTIRPAGPMAGAFLDLGIGTFGEALRWVHELPYGYNSNRDDPMILFREKTGTCTTKHAVIAALAVELGMGVEKSIGIYAMTEALVTGAGKILERYRLPYLPMAHCFLVCENRRVDLTEGNRNGKNGPIDEFLYTEPVAPNISAKEEYLLYRRVLARLVADRPELQGVDVKTILKAREEGLALLKANLRR